MKSQEKTAFRRGELQTHTNARIERLNMLVHFMRNELFAVSMNTQRKKLLITNQRHSIKIPLCDINK